MESQPILTKGGTTFKSGKRRIFFLFDFLHSPISRWSWNSNKTLY